MNSQVAHQPSRRTPLDEYRKESALHACGYVVGVCAPLRSVRESTLLRFFRADLRVRFDPGEYEDVGAAEWGAPGSRARWQRMHSHLSWQRERQGARGHDDAARHLKEDLAYVGGQLMVDSLEWPSITGARHKRAERARGRCLKRSRPSRRS